MIVRNSGKLRISGDYRVNQPIENLKIRIRIMQQKSLLAELFDSENETRDTNYLQYEEKIINWQEKILSKYEINYYKEIKNCKNDLQKNYNEKIINEEIEESKIFTYTKNDNYYYKQDIINNKYESYLSLKNKTALPIIKNRKPFNERYNKKIIENSPSNTTIRSNHYLYRDKTIMYIMADLTSKDDALSNNDDSEILLCTIIYDEFGKILTINPDFNNNESYTIDTTGMSYDYWIEHASEGLNQEELQMQKELLHHELKEKLLHRESEIYPEIFLPPSNILRIYLTLNFTKAYGFPYDALFLTYLIDLPNNWNTIEKEKLSGRTQRCKMINGIANFSFVTEIILDFDLNCLNDEIVQPCWPQILISAGSLDRWTRYRIEGYAAQSLPPLPGRYTYHLKTWRPLAGFINTLRRFFTGGTAELDDFTYSGIPHNHQNKILDKNQLKVVSNGTIDLEINVIQQSQELSKNRGLFRETIDRLSSGTLINSVDNVLEQFKAARERMIRARVMSS